MSDDPVPCYLCDPEAYVTTLCAKCHEGFKEQPMPNESSWWVVRMFLPARKGLGFWVVQGATDAAQAMRMAERVGGGAVPMDATRAEGCVEAEQPRARANA